MANVTELNDSTFDEVVRSADRPVLVDFTAAWRPPRRLMHPVLEQLDGDREDIRVVQVDVDADQVTAARCGVLSMPTFVLFRDGAEALRLIGARPRRRLEAELDAVL